MTPADGAVPPGYPRSCETDVELADGRRVHLRPVVPQDVDELARAVARSDPDTLRRRFLGGAAPRSLPELQRLVSVDYDRRYALAAFDHDGTGVGIARYEGEGTWPAVELAVAVDPAWRGVGLGRELVRGVVRLAAERGATRLTADFFDDNQEVLSLLAEAGLPERRRACAGVVEDELLLDEAARSELGVAASGGAQAADVPA